MGFKHKQVIMLAFGHAVEYVIDEFVTATHIQPRTRFWNLDSKWHGILVLKLGVLICFLILVPTRFRIYSINTAVFGFSSFHSSPHVVVIYSCNSF